MLRLKRYRAVFFVSLICALLSGCGFKLRGQQQLAKSLHSLRLAGVEKETTFGRMLYRAFSDRGVKIVNNDKVAQLEIIQQGFEQRLGQVSANVIVSQAVLTHRLEFRLTNSKMQTISQQTLISSRTLTVNANQLLGSSRERVTVEQELSAETINKLFDVLSSKQVVKRLAA